MPAPSLRAQLRTYQGWKTDLARAIQDLGRWLDEHRRASPRARDHIRSALLTLQRDRLTAVLVAEPGGGPDLINALLFPDLGSPVLPSSLGNAPRCPTELRWDRDRDDPCLRLLPIETRALGTPIAALKGEPEQWVRFALDIQTPGQLAGTLAGIAQTQTLPRAEAARLGLATVASTPKAPSAEDQVEVPRWRYALLNLPHPLLRHGLVILEIPGVGALDLEPELGTAVLAAADAILFLLGAGRGLTGGDHGTWQRHLKGILGARQQALMVAVDTGEGGGVAAAERVASRRRDAAAALGIDADAVLGVSARAGLAARMRKDAGGLRQSGLPLLEGLLGERLLENKREHLMQGIEADIIPLLERHRTQAALQMARVQSTLAGLERLQDQSRERVARLLETTRHEQGRYLEAVQQYRLSRAQLIAETRECRQILEAEAIEALIARGQRELLRSRTTLGLSRAMKSLFDELRAAMQNVATESERLRKLVRATYQRFQEDFALDPPVPQVFVSVKYRVEIELLHQEVDAFRRTPAVTLSRRGVVIRQFHERMVSRARVLFDQLRESFDGWLREALAPLAEEIRDQKALLQTRLENLQRIGRSERGMQERAESLRGHYQRLGEALTALRNLEGAFQIDAKRDRPSPPRLRLIASGAATEGRTPG